MLASSDLIPPVIDISPLLDPMACSKEVHAEVQHQILAACQQWGFFNIINHGISEKLQFNLKQEMDLFFKSSTEVKYSVKRSPSNSRGFADDELTKQITDSKEIFDIGQVHFPNLSEKAQANQMLDGINLWPEADHLTNFKPVMDEYYNAALTLSGILFKAIVEQLVCDEELPANVTNAFETHSSFLRLNMYPIVQTQPSNSAAGAWTGAEAEAVDSEGNVESSSSAKSKNTSNSTPLGISRHTDAGVLTLLLQDSQPGLEVYTGSNQDFGDGE